MYQLRRPAAALRPYIEHYWFVSPGPEGAPVDLRVDVFVDARADLVFNFGAPYARREIGGPATELSASNFDAQRLVPIRIAQRGRVRTCGVRFRLGGVAPFAVAPLARFTGSTPPPEEVLGEPARPLEAALRADDDPDAQAAVLDAWFEAALAAFAPRHELEVLARALALVEATRGAAAVAAIAREAGISERQLERVFARRLGISPKAVCRVSRFQSALGALMRDPGVTLAEVASDAGYYDQAHFVREFRKLSGGVPRGYRGYYPPAGPKDFAPNVVVFVQDEDGPGRA